jgi:hypothetical protein
MCFGRAPKKESAEMMTRACVVQGLGLLLFVTPALAGPTDPPHPPPAMAAAVRAGAAGKQAATLTPVARALATTAKAPATSNAKQASNPAKQWSQPAAIPMPTRADAPTIKNAYVAALRNGIPQNVFEYPPAIQKRANAFEARTGLFEVARPVGFTDGEGVKKTAWVVTGATGPLFFYASNGKLVASAQRDPKDPTNITLDAKAHEPKAIHWAQGNPK